MKKLILTLSVVGLTASMFAATSQLTIDNFNGTGNNHATSLGLFFNGDGTPYTGPLINAVVNGGPAGTAIGSLQAVGSWLGANGLAYAGVPGVYYEQLVLNFDVPGVTAGNDAQLQILAWIGSAGTYGSADGTAQFLAWDGSAFVNAGTRSFLAPTGGGGAPPGPAKSALDGMPAMQLGATIIPEPSTLALAGLGAAALLMYRRRNN